MSVSSPLLLTFTECHTIVYSIVVSGASRAVGEPKHRPSATPCQTPVTNHPRGFAYRGWRNRMKSRFAVDSRLQRHTASPSHSPGTAPELPSVSSHPFIKLVKGPGKPELGLLPAVTPLTLFLPSIIPFCAAGSSSDFVHFPSSR